MGCVHSRHDINDQHANIFQVVNVDDLGYRFSSAMLEVTDSHLVLHQRGRAATRWPLRCLRRYGFDAELFSFESGRRCPTGPGIYAFSCRRAEALFNMLQLQIQNITEDAASRELNAIPVQMHNEFIHSDAANSGAVGATDPDGYLDPLLRPHHHARIMNSIGSATMNATPSGGISSGGVGGAVGGVISGSAGNAVTLSGRGSSGGVCGRMLMRSPPSPTMPISPPPIPFENNHDHSLDQIHDHNQSEELPSSLVHEVREPPPSPPDPIRPVFVNHIDKVVTYENHIGRPTSCGNSYPDRSLLQGNSIPTKRPRSYMNINANQPQYKVSNQVYVNIVPEMRDRSVLPEIRDRNMVSEIRDRNLVLPEMRNHDHIYINLGKEKDVPAVPPRPSLAPESAGSGSSHSCTTTTTTTDTDHQRLNYCVLDLDPGGSDSSNAAAPLSPPGSVASGPESPRRRKDNYIEIDFHKTDALNTAKQASASEDGSRRTRHNSTFTSPGSLIRHNSSLSD